MSSRKKYNCIIEEIDNMQIADLKSKIDDKDSLEPWLLTFIKRFSSLANERALSKKAISDACQESSLQSPQLKGNKDILPQPTLSSITNPDSDNVRLPNVNHLIVLSKFFGVSIDYLVGLSSTRDVNMLPILNSFGLSECSIDRLKLYKKLFDFPKFSPFPKSGIIFDNSGNMDIENLPQSDADGFYDKYYVGNKCFSKEEYKQVLLSFMEDFPEYFKLPFSSNIALNRERFYKMLPDSFFFSTIDSALSYENGLLINLLSQYLFSCSSSDDPASSDALLLSKITSCLVRLHDSINK